MEELMRRVLVRLTSALVVGTSYIVRSLPRRVRYLPADAITLLVGRLWRRKAVVEQNFATVLGAAAVDDRAARLARASVRNFGRMAIDFLAACTMPADEVRSWVTPVGEPYFKEAIAAGHGVIFAMPHMGSWDVGGAYAPAYGFPVTVVIQGHWLAQIVEGARKYQSQGVTLVALDHSMRALFQALRRNEGVVLLSDIIPGSVQSLSVPFFGRPAPFPTGAARLALHTGAPIMTICCVRIADGSYRILVLPPLWPNRDQPQADAVRALTEALARDFERLIAQYPEHWYPFHRIWE
jgi:phosphatidylinositol dimannoside acyltransferase